MAGGLDNAIREGAQARGKPRTTAAVWSSSPLADQIAADKHLASKTASRKPGLGAQAGEDLSSGGVVVWPFSKSRRRRERQMARMVRARYDAAQTTANNARHWAMADSLAADGSASVDVRRKLRERSRSRAATTPMPKAST